MAEHTLTRNPTDHAKFMATLDPAVNRLVSLAIKELKKKRRAKR
jgi:hypothetical protein